MSTDGSMASKGRPHSMLGLDVYAGIPFGQFRAAFGEGVAVSPVELLAPAELAPAGGLST
jgi:hypothetical protein